MRNVEIKARFRRSRKTDSILRQFRARRTLAEDQVDTYYDVSRGRMKVREHADGSAELIHYLREETEGPRISHHEIVPLKKTDPVKRILEREHGIRAVVRKHREVWMWRNVRIHFDRVEGLGRFIEFEVVLREGDTEKEGREKAELLMSAFGITDRDLIYQSYEDFLMHGRR